MKIYEASLYVLDKNIPYFDFHELNGMYTSNSENCLSREILIHKNDTITEYDTNPIFIKSYEKLVVRKQFFGGVVDIVTGLCFPTIEMRTVVDEVYKEINGDDPVKYVLSRPNQRVYAKIEREIKTCELREIYEKLTDCKIKESIDALCKLLHEQEEYKKELPKSNRQYVKKIQQMRNKNLNK